VVSRCTNEQGFAARRQRFLVEQGYVYDIIGTSEILAAGDRGS